MKNVQESSFANLIGKQIKVVYQDLDRESFARGVLQSEDKRLLYIRGDHSYQVIAKESILKLNYVGDL